MIKAFGGGAVGLLGDEGRGGEWDQAHNQPMNTVGAAASSVGRYIYLHTSIYIHNSLLCVCIMFEEA